jgi:hypothetical protein
MKEGRRHSTYIRMNNLLNRSPLRSASLSSREAAAQPPSLVHKLLYLFTWVVVVLALVAGVALLTSDVFLTVLPHAPVSAAPLLLAGAAYLGFQVLIRPKPLDLFKALIVSSAFILWGIDQLFPLGRVATTLGDVVITLYVIDLGWVMIDRLKQRNHIDKEH